MSCNNRVLLTTSALGLLIASACWGQTPQINEFMSSNATTIEDDDGDHSDWIELYNSSSSAIDLTGYYISDDDDTPLKWRFPSGGIPPYGYTIVWASDKNRVSGTGDLHTNFKLANEGEPIILTAPDGTTTVDESPSVALGADVSYGRSPDGGVAWSYFTPASPGSTNSSASAPVATPQFLSPPGFYASTLNLGIVVNDPDAFITYTLDGSEPTESSTLFSDPLVLTDRAGDPETISLIPTNFIQSGHSAWRPPRSEIFKINVVRARAFRDGYEPSAIATGSYVVTDDVVGMCPLDVVSVVSPPPNLFDNNVGIYVPGIHYIPGNDLTGNYFQKDDAWERPGHLEMFDTEGLQLLSQDVGLRIHGGSTRQLPQKSLRIYARSEYGQSELNYRLFPELPYESYKRIVLRNSGDDWGYRAFKDLALSYISNQMGIETLAGRPAIHFVNGEYWGVIDIRERCDQYYISDHFGVAEDDVVILEDNALIDEGETGDADHYLELRNFVASADMTQPANLAWASERMDIDNFIAYMMMEIYCGNTDWPMNNIRYWRKRTTEYVPTAPAGHDGRWRWVLFDLDSGFGNHYLDALTRATLPNGPFGNNGWSTQLLRGLLGNPSFKTSFINSFADHMNSTFMPDRVIDIIDVFAGIYEPAIPAYQERWDITENWYSRVAYLRTFANERPAFQRQHIVDYFDLDGTTTVQVDVNDTDMGKVKVSSLLIDEDLLGLANPAQPYPWTGTYFQGVPLTVTAIPAPGYRFVSWLEDATTDPLLTLMPDADPIVRTAVFEVDPVEPELVHYWHFNSLPAGTLTVVAADYSQLGSPEITYPGSGAGYMDQVAGSSLNARLEAPAGLGLRVRNPADTRELIIELPTTGFRDPVLTLAVWRSSNGAQEVSLEYAVDAGGSGWQPLPPVVMTTEVAALHTWDFGQLDQTDDNSAFRVRLLFGGTNASGSSGNTRYDNITLEARQISGSTAVDPPSVPISLSLRVFPNPFNPVGRIEFESPGSGPIMLEIFDVCGRRVRTFAMEGFAGARAGALVWDGKDDSGRAVASGNYLCRLQASGQTTTKKMQLVR